MTTRTEKTSPLKIARAAGLLYLLVVPLGIFGLSVSSRLIVSGDAPTTARNIMDSELLFRLSIVSDVLATLIMLSVVLILYQLLKPVNNSVALLMVVFVLVAVPIVMLNQLNQFAVLQLLSEADYLSVFTTQQLQVLVLLFLGLSSRGANIAFIFWGLWLFPLGYLVFKSGFFPRILGILLMIACIGYVTSSFATLLGYTLNTGPFAALGEVLFILWLVIKGVNAEQWNKRNLESA